MKVINDRLSGRLILATIAAAILLSACGQKGSLYLPDEKKATYTQSR